MSRNPFSRTIESLIPGAPTELLQQWLREHLSEYDRLKGRSALKSFRSASRRRIEAIAQELANRGVDASCIRSDDTVQEASTPVSTDRPTKKVKQQIMYIEAKPGLTGPARIGRVQLSKTGRTLYYAGQKFQSLKGAGFKANYFNVETGVEYWISRCRKDGQDTLYPGTVQIDEEVRDEYWLSIRERPDRVQDSEFRSESKYSKRRPQPEKPNGPASGPRR